MTTKIHALVDALGNPVEVMLTAGQDHDLTCAEPLIEAVDPAALIADKAFDADAFITALNERAITPVIPSKSNRSTRARAISPSIANAISSISTRHGDSQDSAAGTAALSAGFGGRRRQGGGVARIAFNAAIVSGSARTSTPRFEPEPTLRQDRRPFWTQV